jgi:hypothetical protein
MLKKAAFSPPALVLALLLSTPLQAAISQPAPQPLLPQPSTEHQPEDVVRIVIEALARNDDPFTDAGIATTFAFASPANRINTGPLEKFSKMVRNPAYGVMIDHVEHEFSKVVTTGNNAYQMVKITGNNGVEVIFAFRLSRQLDGEHRGMWMTDAVWPVARGEISEPAF